MIRSSLSAGSLGAALLTFALCGPGVAFADDTVRVTLDDRPDGTMVLLMDHDRIEAGKVTFVVQNASQDMEHEFIVVRTDLGLDELPMTEDGTAVEEEGLGELHELEELEPGKTDDLVLHLEPGHYVALCNLPGHFAAGMRAEFTVVAPEAGVPKSS